MEYQQIHRSGTIIESIRGIVDRITYHNQDNGWSVLRVLPFDNPHQQETVTVHQTKVFAGATMEFHGSWTLHPKFGRQFKAVRALEKKTRHCRRPAKISWVGADQRGRTQDRQENRTAFRKGNPGRI